MELNERKNSDFLSNFFFPFFLSLSWNGRECHEVNRKVDDVENKRTENIEEKLKEKYENQIEILNLLCGNNKTIKSEQCAHRDEKQQSNEGKE